LRDHYILSTTDARSGRYDPKLDRLAERLDLAKAGQLPERQRQEPAAGPAGDLDALSDIAGSGLVHAAALGESTLFRHAGELAQAERAIQRPSTGPERDAEQGLWIAAKMAGVWQRTGGGLVAPTRP